MKSFTILFTALFFYGLSGFVSPDNNLKDLIGTYSVCQIENYPVALTLNQDLSFTYRDKTDLSNPIVVSGAWSMDKNTIILKDKNGSTNFHRKWKLKKDNCGIASRKGMSFYSLCKLDNCK
ncbi:hypothetical protein DNU06_04040 [Putridiphycobacter roseus]|uniref:Lipocalin-like domain-containing protein n=1 Tax=Putridiphycobacter roseus TaxID=2219161 RepID=A0A2W1NSZ3_9FLAO|nr:hypothetical protein [Putridiphycobacter roseus]PZE17798.1 hypothetical protein DNU06_04040 [Putridiphycobacter roseus]